MFKPKISLVIPAYNEEKYIEATLEAIEVAIRSYEKKINEKIEVILVNNNSTDNTAKIAKQYGCKIINFKRHNIGAVRNAGAKSAEGEFIAFIDADSIISDNSLVNIHKNLQKEEVFGGGARTRPDRPINVFKSFYGIIDILFEFIVTECLFHIFHTFIYLRKEDFEKMNGFDESWFAFEDGQFFNRMKKLSKIKNQKILCLDEPVFSSTRKLKSVKTSTFFSLYPKLLFEKGWKKEEGWKKEGATYEIWYNVDNLR